MNCSSNNIYMYVGLGFVLVITVIIAMKLVKKNGRIMEGLTDGDDETTTTIKDVVSKLKKKSELLEDSLLIDKHRSDYEDLFLALEDYCNLALLDMLTIFAGNPSLESKGGKTMIEGINEINTLKTTLNDVMEFMDGKQTNTKTITSYFNS